MLTPELLNKLKHIDEVALLELLNISTEDLIDAFYSRIEDNLAYINGQVQEEDN